MNISDRNFMASQAGYGLMIAKNADLPDLTASNEEWDEALDRIAALSFRLADRQIERGKEAQAWP